MVKFPNHRHVLSFDERDHIIREWCDWIDPSVSLALWSFSLLLLLSSLSKQPEAFVTRLDNSLWTREEGKERKFAFSTGKYAQTHKHSYTHTLGRSYNLPQLTTKVFMDVGKCAHIPTRIHIDQNQKKSAATVCRRIDNQQARNPTPCWFWLQLAARQMSLSRSIRQRRVWHCDLEQ